MQLLFWNLYFIKETLFSIPSFPFCFRICGRTVKGTGWLCPTIQWPEEWKLQPPTSKVRILTLIILKNLLILRNTFHDYKLWNLSYSTFCASCLRKFIELDKPSWKKTSSIFCYFINTILTLSPKQRWNLHLITATSKICRNTFAYARTRRIYVLSSRILKLTLKWHQGNLFFDVLCREKIKLWD